MAQFPNIHIRTDPPNLSGSIQFVVKIDERKAVRVHALLKDFPNEVELGYKIGAQEFATKLHRLVRRCLKTGIPPKGVSWPPHSPVTTKMLGPHPLLHLTGFYYRYIKIIQNKTSIAVGLPSGLKRPAMMKGSSKLTMKQIAVINEYGGGRIPPRPLWRPAYEQIGGKVGLKKCVTNWIRKIIKEEVKRCNMVSNTLSMSSTKSLISGPTLKDWAGSSNVSGVNDLPF